MTWQVEHAQEPPQAPSMSRSSDWAMSRRLVPGRTETVWGVESLRRKVTERDSSPGAGGSMCPWEREEVVESLRRGGGNVL